MPRYHQFTHASSASRDWVNSYSNVPINNNPSFIPYSHNGIVQPTIPSSSTQPQTPDHSRVPPPSPTEHTRLNPTILLVTSPSPPLLPQTLLPTRSSQSWDVDWNSDSNYRLPSNISSLEEYSPPSTVDVDSRDSEDDLPLLHRVQAHSPTEAAPKESHTPMSSSRQWVKEKVSQLKSAGKSLIQNREVEPPRVEAWWTDPNFPSPQQPSRPAIHTGLGRVFNLRPCRPSVPRGYEQLPNSSNIEKPMIHSTEESGSSNPLAEPPAIDPSIFTVGSSTSRVNPSSTLQPPAFLEPLRAIELPLSKPCLKKRIICKVAKFIFQPFVVPNLPRGRQMTRDTSVRQRRNGIDMTPEYDTPLRPLRRSSPYVFGVEPELGLGPVATRRRLDLLQ